jgi:hypothetical protein
VERLEAHVSDLAQVGGWLLAARKADKAATQRGHFNCLKGAHPGGARAIERANGRAVWSAAHISFTAQQIGPIRSLKFTTRIPEDLLIEFAGAPKLPNQAV